MSTAEIKGRMSLDAKGVKVGTDAAQRNISDFQKQVSGLSRAMAGAFTFGAAASFARSIASFGSEISDAAFQTGLSTDEFQAFREAARDGGADLQQVVNGLVSLRDAQSAALSGEETYRDAFAALGITLDDVARNSMPELLEAVARGAKTTGNFGAVVDLFGKRNAAKLEEALYLLADEGFGALNEAMSSSGRMMTELEAQMLDLADDKIGGFLTKIKVGSAEAIGAFERLVTRLQAFGNGVKAGLAVGDGMFFDADAFSEAYSAITDAYVANQEDAIAALEERRKKSLEREKKQREKMIEKLYGKEAEEAAKLAGKEQEKDARKAHSALSVLDAVDSFAKIGGKIGGENDLLARQVAEQLLVLRGIEGNTAAALEKKGAEVRIVD